MHAKNDILAITETLINFSEKHDLVNKAIAGCHEAIENCIQSDLENGIEPFGGFIRENVRLQYHSQYLITDHIFSRSPIFRTRLSLFNKNGPSEEFAEMEIIGSYENDTDEDGKCIDDWLILKNKGSFDR